MDEATFSTFRRWDGVKVSEILFYKFQLTPSVSLTPDIQWVRGSYGGLTNGDDALVFGTRMNINL